MCRVFTFMYFAKMLNVALLDSSPISVQSCDMSRQKGKSGTHTILKLERQQLVASDPCVTVKHNNREMLV